MDPRLQESMQVKKKQKNKNNFRYGQRRRVAQVNEQICQETGT